MVKKQKFKISLERRIFLWYSRLDLRKFPGRRLKLPLRLENTAAGPMDFIEKILGVAPDGGSGALEAAMFLAPSIAAALFAYLRARRISKKCCRNRWRQKHS